MNTDRSQREVCALKGSEYLPSGNNEKLGIAINTLGLLPLNALRHPPENDTCGWYIWGGETMSQDLNFFQVLHVQHIESYAPKLIPYLALAPGWRVLLAPGQIEVWYDVSLLSM